LPFQRGFKTLPLTQGPSGHLRHIPPGPGRNLEGSKPLTSRPVDLSKGQSPHRLFFPGKFFPPANFFWSPWVEKRNGPRRPKTDCLRPRGPLPCLFLRAGFFFVYRALGGPGLAIKTLAHLFSANRVCSSGRPGGASRGSAISRPGFRTFGEKWFSGPRARPGPWAHLAMAIHGPSGGKGAAFYSGSET